MKRNLFSLPLPTAQEESFLYERFSNVFFSAPDGSGGLEAEEIEHLNGSFGVSPCTWESKIVSLISHGNKALGRRGQQGEGGCCHTRTPVFHLTPRGTCVTRPSHKRVTKSPERSPDNWRKHHLGSLIYPFCCFWHFHNNYCWALEILFISARSAHVDL